MERNAGGWKIVCLVGSKKDEAQGCLAGGSKILEFTLQVKVDMCMETKTGLLKAVGSNGIVRE